MSIRTFFAVAAAAAMILGTAASARPTTPSANAFPGVFAGLTDQNGRRFDPASLANRFVLVNFIFTGCGSTCPMQTQDLARFERALPPRLRARLSLLSVSVDPANDTPVAMRRYAKAFAVDGDRWRFLTGDEPAIARVTRLFTALRPDRTGGSTHTSEVRLFDPGGRMIQRYAGAPLASTQLRADLLALAAPRS